MKEYCAKNKQKTLIFYQVEHCGGKEREKGKQLTEYEINWLYLHTVDKTSYF